MFNRNREYRLRSLASHCTGAILDVGCGTGNPYLTKGTTGFDKFEFKLPNNYARLVQGDVTQLLQRFDRASFDTVYASELIEHLSDPVKFIDDCAEILRKGGRLVISTDNPYRLQTLLGNVFLKEGTRNLHDTYAVHDFGHVNFFLPRMLNAIAAEAGLKVERIFCVEGLPLPFLEQKLGYVYAKTGEIKKAEPVLDHRGKSAQDIYQ